MQLLTCSLQVLQSVVHSTSVYNAAAEDEKIPDDLWVQCDFPQCLKWRKMPAGTHPDSLPDNWFCYNHPDPSKAALSHTAPEEAYKVPAEVEVRNITYSQAFLWPVWLQQPVPRKASLVLAAATARACQCMAAVYGVDLALIQHTVIGVGTK